MTTIREGSPTGRPGSGELYLATVLSTGPRNAKSLVVSGTIQKVGKQSLALRASCPSSTKRKILHGSSPARPWGTKSNDSLKLLTEGRSSGSFSEVLSSLSSSTKTTLLWQRIAATIWQRSLASSLVYWPRFRNSCLIGSSPSNFTGAASQSKRANPFTECFHLLDASCSTARINGPRCLSSCMRPRRRKASNAMSKTSNSCPTGDTVPLMLASRIKLSAASTTVWSFIHASRVCTVERSAIRNKASAAHGAAQLLLISRRRSCTTTVADFAAATSSFSSRVLFSSASLRRAIGMACRGGCSCLFSTLPASRTIVNSSFCCLPHSAISAIASPLILLTMEMRSPGKTALVVFSAFHASTRPPGCSFLISKVLPSHPADCFPVS